jgi:amino acid permease
VLALPAKTLAAGFLPSSGALFLCWVYMAASGLLIAEVNVNTLCSLERDAVSITSMAAETIGEAGARLCGVAYVFIHYSLLVAYFLQGAALLLELLHLTLSLTLSLTLTLTLTLPLTRPLTLPLTLTLTLTLPRRRPAPRAAAQ